MKKSQNLSLILLTASALLASGAFAQTPSTSGSAQTPGSKPQTSSGTAASKPQSSTAAKKPGTAASTKPGAAAPLVLKTDRQKASYVIGTNIGKQLKQIGIDDIDTALLARGVKDFFAGSKFPLTEEQAQKALVAYSTEVKKRVELRNQKEGDTFLAANKAKPGVVTLPSGLQYKILSAGTGPKPTAQDTVLCNYRGTLINGTEFDNSVKHGGATEIPVGSVIKGWTEALQLMPVGSKWELYVPGDLAYGPRQAGPDIGPNSTLIFDVELVSIKEKPKEEPKPAATGDAKDAPKPAAQPASQPAPQPAPQQPAPQPTPPPQPAPKPPSR